MEQSYIVWSTRMQGWWSVAGNTSSDIKQAKSFGRTAALAFCQKHMNNGLSEFGLLPICLDDLRGMGVDV